jgi:high-affinity iron transporter
VALVVVALGAAALIPGSHSSGGPRRFGVAKVAAPSPVADPLKRRVTKVFGSNVPARLYGSEVGAQENEGTGPNGQLSSDLSPLPPRAFARPIASYRTYAEHWAATLDGSLPALRNALAAGHRPAAKRTWGVAFADYLHLGAVYGLLPARLNAALAGLPPVIGERHFSGLHRIEMGLWGGASPRSLTPVATALTQAVATLRKVLPKVSISPLDYATRAHEILEDAQRDLMSGSQVPWSGAGVLGTEAGIEVTREVISTLTPLLQGRDNTLAESQDWLDQLQQTFMSVRRPGGAWPTLGQLSEEQRERLDGTLDGTLGALSQVPGTLETSSVPVIPKLPANG